MSAKEELRKVVDRLSDKQFDAFVARLYALPREDFDALEAYVRNLEAQEV